MEKIILGASIVVFWACLGTTALAKQQVCDNQSGLSPMKAKMCEVINAEDTLVTELGGYVEAACPLSNDSAGCNSLRKRHGNLQNVQGRAHEENNSLEENDFQEMIEGAYKGRNKKDNGDKTCKTTAVDPELRDEYLDELDIGVENPDGYYAFGGDKDREKAEDDQCNNWKVVWMEPNASGGFVKASGAPVKISEKQEGLCLTECKGKQGEVKAKGERFNAELEEAIGQINIAAQQMAAYAPQFAAKAQFYAVQADNGTAPLCPKRPDALVGSPISTEVVLTSYAVNKALEITTEVCKHPANQDILGNNGASACTPLEVAYRIAKEVYDMMEFLNADFQGTQIEFIEKCVEKMGDTIAEIKEIVQRIEMLVVTPQGRRATETLDWPNKLPIK